MGIFFSKEAIKRLSSEQFEQLNSLANAAEAENINEQDDAAKEAMNNYIADYKQKEAESAAYTSDLVSSFV